MVRLLVESGACILATTVSDDETAAEKCEEDEEGFRGCSEYLYSESRLSCRYNCTAHTVLSQVCFYSRHCEPQACKRSWAF